MKFLVFLTVMVTVNLYYMSSHAQENREREQNRRMSHEERLQKRLKKMEERANADGVVTPEEQKRIDNMKERINKPAPERGGPGRRGKPNDPGKVPKN